MFPLNIEQLSLEKVEEFNKYFLNENKEFFFEGMWFRNQRPENASQSCYVDETTKRRRYLHFYNTYINNKGYFSLKNVYIYVSNTLPKEENEKYLQKILAPLKQNFIEVEKNTFELDDLCVYIKEYDVHPKNELANITFPENYSSLDVVITTKGYDYKPVYNRMWEHSTKMFRVPGIRQNPTYINSLEEIKDYLPAQVEMGCGPSISAGIDPLYVMHETYKVQDHHTKKFYFGDADTFLEDFFKNPQKSLIYFSQTPLKCLKADPTSGYKAFKKVYDKGLFVGTVLNNNFDRLVKRMDIPEIILRTYQKDLYIQNIEFDPRAKSLITFGCHADRRQVEKQAREHGLKVIFIDPERFIKDGQEEKYPVEAPQDGDFVYNKTFEEVMKEFQNLK